MAATPTYTGLAALPSRAHPARDTSWMMRWAVGTGAFAGCYDSNGNMTCRVVDGAGYILTYDSENHLTSVSGGGGANVAYTYDGDGNRVKSSQAYANLAAGIPATSSGTLNWPSVVTNEDIWADSGSGSSGEFAYTSQTGLQYVQLDLGAVYSVDKIKVWHYAADGRTYHKTKTQVSQDGSTWYTVFDSADGEYAETAAGKTSTFTTRSVRYVRDYLNGSTANSGNHWVEIEVWGSLTTAYVGNYFEWTGSTSTMVKNYYAGNQRVAMRVGSALTNFLLGDHLGSTAITADSSGNKLTELRYKPWGEKRYANGTTLTTFRFTGQRQESSLGAADGLYYYGARWYDPALGRFIQPDTIIPQNQGVQAFDRYAYVNNNPVKYNDPSGHCFLVCAAIGAVVGAVVGAATVALPLMIKNVQAGQPLTANIDPAEVGKAALIGAGAGAVIGGTLGVGLAAAGIIGGGGSTAVTTAAVTGGGAATTAATTVLNATGGDPTDEISTVTQTGLQMHHLIEQRFAPALGQTAAQARQWLSVAVTPEEHQIFTNNWRSAIGYINSNNPINTATATANNIWAAAQRIYADYPAMLDAARKTLGME